MDFKTTGFFLCPTRVITHILHTRARARALHRLSTAAAVASRVHGPLTPLLGTNYRRARQWDTCSTTINTRVCACVYNIVFCIITTRARARAPLAQTPHFRRYSDAAGRAPKDRMYAYILCYTRRCCYYVCAAIQM